MHTPNVSHNNACTVLWPYGHNNIMSGCTFFTSGLVVILLRHPGCPWNNDRGGVTQKVWTVANVGLVVWSCHWRLHLTRQISQHPLQNKSKRVYGLSLKPKHSVHNFHLQFEDSVWVSSKYYLIKVGLIFSTQSIKIHGSFLSIISISISEVTSDF